MPAVEVSRTLVKSVPELWAQLYSDSLVSALGKADVVCVEPQRALSWQTRELSGTAVLEPTSWGTKVTLTAELNGSPKRRRLFFGLLRRRAKQVAPAEIDRSLRELLDYLGTAHRRPWRI